MENGLAPHANLPAAKATKKLAGKGKWTDHSGFALDMILAQAAFGLQLLAGKNEPLLIGRNVLFGHDDIAEILDSGRWRHVGRNRFAREGLDKDLFDWCQPPHRTEA